MQERQSFGASDKQLTRGDALLESWMKMNCQSIAVLAAGAVRCWSLWSWRQWERQGHKTSAGRQNWFHIQLPLKAKELIRASQTSVTICTKFKKKSSEGWKNRQAWQMASLLERSSWFNSEEGSIQEMDSGMACQGGLQKYYLGM